jgi:hypothetical protein
MFPFNFCLSQKGTPVLHGYAFRQVSFPGMNRTDDNGNSNNKIDTSYFIYLVTKKAFQLKVDKVCIFSNLYTASVFPVNELNVNVGKVKPTGKSFIISINESSLLWKLELIKTDNASKCCLKEYNKIIVHYQNNLHSKTVEMPILLELQPNDSY